MAAPVSAATPPEPPATYREQMQFLVRYIWRLRFFAVFVGLELLLFIVLGFFFAIVFGMLGNLLLRLAAVWNPAYQLAGRILGIPNMPPRLAPPPRSALIALSLPSLVRLGIIGALLWLLFRIGFCSQNFLCLLLSMPR